MDLKFLQLVQDYDAGADSDLDRFLSEFVRLAAAFKVNKEIYAVALCSKLKGSAKSYVDSLPIDDYADFDKLCAALKKRFLSPTVILQKKLTLHAMSQGSLSPSDHARRVLRLARQVDPEMSEAEKVLVITRGLNDALRQSIALVQYPSSADLLEALERVEAVKPVEPAPVNVFYGGRGRGGPRGRRGRGGPAAPARGSPRLCFNCGKPGHIAKFCRVKTINSLNDGDGDVENKHGDNYSWTNIITSQITKIRLMVFGLMCYCVLDSGAAVSAISSKFLNSTSHKRIYPCTESFQVADGKHVSVSHYTFCKIPWGSNLVSHKLYVIKGLEHDVLLGTDFLRKTKAILDFDKGVLGIPNGVQVLSLDKTQGSWQDRLNKLVSKVQANFKSKPWGTDKVDDEMDQISWSSEESEVDKFVGRRIKVYWPNHGWYEGKVVSVSDNPLEGTHEVLYDDSIDKGPVYERLVGDNKERYKLL